jgi:hypothetical protein
MYPVIITTAAAGRIVSAMSQSLAKTKAMFHPCVYVIEAEA